MFQGQSVPPPPPGGATYPYPQYGMPMYGQSGQSQPGYGLHGYGLPGYGQQGPPPPPQGQGYPYGSAGPSGQMPYNEEPPKYSNGSHTINNFGNIETENNWAGFADKSIRQAFVRKVYSILSVQLLFTFGMIALFLFNPAIKAYVRTHPQIYFFSYILFFSFYLVLVCCQSVARKHPMNIIMLTILTASMGYMTAALSSYYNIESVLMAAGITASCCIAITLFATCTKYDITSCAGVLFIISWVFFISTIIFGLFVRGDQRRTFQLIYSCIGALLFMLYLAYETQLIFGGKSYEYSPEDYVVATIQLYLDIINIFVFILSIIGGGNKN